MEHAADTAEATPTERADDHDTPTLDHPAEADPRPSPWARLTGRARTADRPVEPTRPAPGPIAEPLPEPSAPPARTTSIPVVQNATARRIAIVLALLLAAVVAVAFRGSWTAHRDAATAAHFDPTGAFLYPFAPDGLIVLALVGAVVLRHQRWPRVYCLGVVTLFTVSSYTINHLHGLGSFATVPGTDVLVKALPGVVVGLIAGQLVGAIAFGSHILMHVFRHLFPEALDVQTAPAPAAVVAAVPVAAPPAERPGSPAMSDPQAVQDTKAEETEEAARPEADGRELARLIYGACLDGGVKLSQAKLGELARISKRQAGYVQVDVETERAEAAQREAAEQEAAEVIAQLRGEMRGEPRKVLAVNGSATASGPAGGEA
ncbi:DUF2637 domain-containing protein [Streptosporangium sp. NPDC000239]|uniref:DUF2637 domain-containing protein n=1 Tax=Streptosporangium sp. NPDC000239 TaxID=3154248 RepID=UPI003324CF91